MTLTLALEPYELTRPLLDGRVPLQDVATVLVGSGPRHERMLLEQAYDAAELSMSSYVLARARGAALTAVPAFPRRLFAPSCIYVRRGIVNPADLLGGRIGVYSLQFTMSVVARGDLHHHLGVPMDAVTWLRAGREIVPHISSLPVADRPGADLWGLLAAGEIDAVISPDVPDAFEEGRVRRLFPEFEAVERDLYAKTGVYPIMHVVAMTDRAVERRPSLPQQLYDAFARAKALAGRALRQPYATGLVWGRAALEDQERLFGDAFPYDLGPANRASLEQLMQYQSEQGLLRDPQAVDGLFARVDAPTRTEG
jgi:4,5-dihydroxyphthalate decarboxylase